MIPGPNVPATQIRMLGGILVGGPTRPFFFSVGQDVDWFGASWGEMDEAVERAMEACKRQLEVAAIEILKKQGYDCGKCSMRAHAGDVLDFKCHLAVKLVGDGGCNSTAQGFLDRIPICVVICEEGIKEFEVICFCPGREVS